MPKATDAPSVPSAQVLKRNQACHQCRKRKLKCDAQRPCGTCKRSHRNALAHAEPGQVVPPQPDCSYDELPPPNAPTESGPKTRFERLEGRMRELEAMVKEKEQLTQQLLQQLSPDSHPSSAQPAPATYQATNPNIVYTAPQDANQPPPSLDNLPNNATPVTSQAPYDMDMFYPNYPRLLPAPDLLHHLVDVFFNFFVHANRILHRPTFQASLSLPPSSAGYPKTPLLHAICAIASSYTSLVQQPPLPDYKQQPAREIFKDPQRGPSFGELQARYAKESMEEAIQSGDGIFEAFQAMLLVAWFNFSQAKWVESWLSTGQALRSLTPLGLNICEPHVPLRRTLAPVYLLPQARDVIEDETRRNCFWLAYSMERFQTVGTGWAATLDDEDVTQVLPVTSENFISGIRVPVSIRQRFTTPQVLTIHPPGQTDSFTLYIKSAHLLSVVKSFNHRILSKTLPLPHQADDLTGSRDVDARQTTEFHSVEALISAFALSLARQFRNPVKDGLVDSHLYVASIASHLALIVLHAPHIVLTDPHCSSSEKVLSACRSILESVYTVCNTSFDLGLLDSFCSMAWVIPAQELVRFARARIEMGNIPLGLQLRADLEVFRLAMGRMAEKVPLAYRRLLLLEDAIKVELDPLLGTTDSATNIAEIPLSVHPTVPSVPADNRAYVSAGD